MLSREQKFVDMLQYNIELDRQIASTKGEDIMNCMVGTYRKLNIE